MKYREVERKVKGSEVSDGAGVRLNRILTREWQKRLDPFLMLDEFKSENPDDYIAGFPSHPHRGFETVTYMLEGRMRHRDNTGHEGILVSGGAQWMTAGRGIIHSEIPEQEKGLMHGFQLWINLPSARKMSDPSYKDLRPEEIPFAEKNDAVVIKAIAGENGAIRRPDTEPLYLDIALSAQQILAQTIPSTHNAFVYVYEGKISIGNTLVDTGEMAILDNEAESVRVFAQKSARFILVSGKPVKEPIVQWGPFVMNSREEVNQAIADYNNGLF